MFLIAECGGCGKEKRPTFLPWMTGGTVGRPRGRWLETKVPGTVGSHSSVSRESDGGIGVGRTVPPRGAGEVEDTPSVPD